MHKVSSSNGARCSSWHLSHYTVLYQPQATAGCIFCLFLSLICLVLFLCVFRETFWGFTEVFAPSFADQGSLIKQSVGSIQRVHTKAENGVKQHRLLHFWRRRWHCGLHGAFVSTKIVLNRGITAKFVRRLIPSTTILRQYRTVPKTAERAEPFFVCLHYRNLEPFSSYCAITNHGLLFIMSWKAWVILSLACLRLLTLSLIKRCCTHYLHLLLWSEATVLKCGVIFTAMARHWA